ncbi:bolA-like protein 3 [Ptychodera flava]|uniref:bolA-like protein 3 n=1 Tax=Ptychodera flava TaxID=63121 RepID=UPI003969F9E6
MFRAVLSRRINLAAPWRFRFFSSQTEGETRISSILKEKFPAAESIDVSDISGGCGAMYEITIVSDEFKGKRTVMQHRMVNQALAEEVKQMHGLRIQTFTTEQAAAS